MDELHYPKISVSKNPADGIIDQLKAYKVFLLYLRWTNSLPGMRRLSRAWHLPSSLSIFISAFTCPPDNQNLDPGVFVPNPDLHISHYFKLEMSPWPFYLVDYDSLLRAEGHLLRKGYPTWVWDSQPRPAPHHFRHILICHYACSEQGQWPVASVNAYLIFRLAQAPRTPQSLKYQVYK